MNFPDELLYTKDHEWVRKEGTTAHVGITDFAQRELGDIVYVDVNTVGKEVQQGEVFGTVEAVKTVADLFMPLSGKVVEINPALDNHPEQVNNDPYGEGWIIKVEVRNGAGTPGLLNSRKYQELIAQ